MIEKKTTVNNNNIQYVTDARGIGNSANIGGTTVEGYKNTIFGADPRIDVVAKDTYTGQVVTLTNVRVKQTEGVMLNGIAPDSKFKLFAPDYQSFKKKRIDQMELIPVSTPPPVQNEALPQPIKIKDTLGAFGERPSPICNKLDDNIMNAHKRMGIIYERTDIHILQGKQNGRSPGIAIDPNSGKILMFDNSGKQYVGLDGQEIKLHGNEVNTGNASEGRDFLGIPSTKNQVNDFVPQGTIVSPQPRLIPNIAKVINTIYTIKDMIELIKACKDAVNVIKSTEAGSEARTNARRDLMNNNR